MEKKNKQTKKHVLLLLCIVIYFSFENGCGARLDGMKRKICMEFWAAAHSFGMSNEKFFFSQPRWRSVPPTLVAVILSAWMAP